MFIRHRCSDLHTSRKGKIMEELKQAIITPDKKIKCPICQKTNGRITGQETIRNYKVRCRASRRGWEHFFVLNVEKEEKAE